MENDPGNDDLVEKVARALAKAGYAFAGIALTDPYSADADYWNNQARAALSVARAAIKEECVDAVCEVGDHASASAYAAVIRAME